MLAFLHKSLIGGFELCFDFYPCNPLPLLCIFVFIDHQAILSFLLGCLQHLCLCHRPKIITEEAIFEVEVRLVLCSDSLNCRLGKLSLCFLVARRLAERFACIFEVAKTTACGVRDLLPALVLYRTVLWDVRARQVTLVGETIRVDRLTLQLE